MIYLIWRTEIDHMLQFDAGLRTICSIYIFKNIAGENVNDYQKQTAFIFLLYVQQNQH